MRTITSTLKDAQEDVSNTPYVRLVFTHGSTTHDYSDRKLLVEHHEEPYNDYAIILLQNEDRAVPDLTGYYVDIGYGHETTSGEEYSTSPRLWVKAQSNISLQGKLVVALTLEGMWSLMGEQQLIIGNPPFYDDDPYTTSTAYGIIEAIIETELSAATSLGFTLDALGGQDDSIINTFIPKFYPNETAYDDINTLIQLLMDMTKCYLRAEASLQFKVVYPQESDSVDENYYSAQAHYFLEYAEKTNLLIPNYIIVFCNRVNDWDASSIITGEAQDTDQQAKYMVVKGLFTAPTITTQFDASTRAAVILTRLKAEVLSGRLIIPHDCSVELYDRVAIHDTRGT